MTDRKTIVPPIKCQGIKTKLVPWIRAVVPDNFTGTWIEPFMGSSVVAVNVQPSKAVLADSNPHLVCFYQAVSTSQITPQSTRTFLEREGKLLSKTDGEHYYKVRDRFNENSEPLDFLFLNRSCFNGMIRFNRKGEFNVPFCRKPNRFSPAYVTKICNQVQAVSDVCASCNFEFVCQDYRTTIGQAGADDLLYCDPPYVDRHTDYFNGWDDQDEEKLGAELGATPARFMLSTWHSNDFRANEFIDRLWADYNILTREHFYHVGAKEENRNRMLEALITNFEIHATEEAG